MSDTVVDRIDFNDITLLKAIYVIFNYTPGTCKYRIKRERGQPNILRASIRF